MLIGPRHVLEGLLATSHQHLSVNESKHRQAHLNSQPVTDHTQSWPGDFLAHLKHTSKLLLIGIRQEAPPIADSTPRCKGKIA